MESNDRLGDEAAQQPVIAETPEATTSSSHQQQQQLQGATALETPCPTSSQKALCDADAASSSKKNKPEAAASHECPICLQTCIHPARLPCGHIFCFLCVKGVAYKNRRCAMCRREIPPEYLDHPQLVNGIDDICTTKTTEDGYQWFYEGRNGWWQYDDRTSQDIEDAYKNGEKSCTILVAGYVYIVDLEAMLQQRQNEPSRCRRVKRDLATITKKGVAGLRIDNTTEPALTSATQSYDEDVERIEDEDEDNPFEIVRRRWHLASFNSVISISDTSSGEDNSSGNLDFGNRLNDVPGGPQSTPSQYDLDVISATNLIESLTLAANQVDQEDARDNDLPRT